MNGSPPAPSLELLGQKIPVTGWTAVISLIVALTIVGGIVGPNLIAGKNVEVDAGTFTYKVTDGVVISTSKERLLIFWTPSQYTRADTEANKEEVKPYYDASDSSGPEGKVEKFAKLLMDMGARGYNRFEVYGQGTSNPKRGYLWRLTSDAKDQRFDRENFVRTYSKFWQRTENIYVEEYDFPAKSR